MSSSECEKCHKKMTCHHCENKDPSPWFSRLSGKTNITTLANNIIDGNWGLVTFQRDSVWTETNQLELFQSLYFGVPVGVIYAWKSRNNTKSKIDGTDLKRHPSRGFEGFENQYGDGSKATHLILDGQQRLTTLAKLHASISDKMKMPHLIVNLENLSTPGNENPFRFAKSIESLGENEVHIQKLIEIGATKFISQHNFEKKHIQRINQLHGSFTNENYIAVQECEAWIENSDALHIFITVNQAGSGLDKLDLAESILRAHWTEFPNKMRNLVNECAQINVGWKKVTKESPSGGTDEKTVPDLRDAYIKFNRVALLRCVLWDLYGTTDYGKTLDNELKVYGATNKKGEILLGKHIERSFDNVKTAALKYKSYLLKRLHFDNLNGLVDYSIINGICFCMKHKNPNPAQIGKLLTWTIANSYFTHWTGGSTFDNLDKAIEILSENNVKWNDLYSEIKISKRPEVANFGKNNLEFIDLLPTEEWDWLGEANLSTKSAKGYPYQNLLRCTLPRFYNLQDWRTGDTFDQFEMNKPTIHHIFPQSRFEDTEFTNCLSKILTPDYGNISFSEIIEDSSNDIKKIGQSVKLALSGAKKDATKEIKRLEKWLKENTTGGSVAKNKRKIDAAKKRLEKYKKHLESDFDNKESILETVKSAAEWWYLFGSDRNNLRNRVGNIAYLLGPTNSSLGSEWPHISIGRYILAHKERIEGYDIPTNNMKILKVEKYQEFCQNREKQLLSKIRKMLLAFNEGVFTEEKVKTPKIGILDIMKDDHAELKVERKETMLYDVNEAKATPKKKNYLLSTIVRAAVSWANMGGGDILIGVNDNGEVLGLERDFEILKERYPTDNPEDKFNAMLTENLGHTKPAMSYTIKYNNFKGKRYCWINVTGSIDEIQQLKFLKKGRKQRKAYWQRTSKGSEEYSLFSIDSEKIRVRRPGRGTPATSSDDGIEILERDNYYWQRKKDSESEWNIKSKI